jgi:quinol monooxygenase YgiN
VVADKVHIVMWRLAPDARASAAQEVSAALNSMLGVIPGLLTLEVGIDERRRANSYDIVLSCRFADAAALESYHDHPAHEAVKPLVRELCRDSAVVDYFSA